MTNRSAPLRSALEATQEALSAIRARDGRYKAMVTLTEDEALKDAQALDARQAQEATSGALAGVPFGVKALFDVAGLPTTAGAGMLRDAPAATADAPAVQRLKDAGGILVGVCNMDEFAYGFVTVNAHYGTTTNPHDTQRLAGGSSGGSAAAVAGELLPLTLGSDTNGSIRVPASLCGIYGIKPAHGALPVEGTYPFVECLDDIGPFTRTAAELRLAYDILAARPTSVSGDTRDRPLRVARLGGWFATMIGGEASAAMDALYDRLGIGEAVELPDVARARSAAFIITACEGGTHHLPALRRDPMGFDPAVRDRLLAGALFPASAYIAAKAFQQQFVQDVLALFDHYDVLIAPATPDVAPRIDDPFVDIGGKRMPARANLGILTQPLSLAAVPVVAAPLLRPGRLPLGIQLVGAPGREDQLFAFAEQLERDGVTGYSPPPDLG